MSIGKLLILIIASIMLAVGATLIYDARIIVKKKFDFGERNEATNGLKILGFIILVAGAVIFLFQI